MEAREYVLSARKRLGLTQVQFAEKLLCDSTTVSRWECGASSPSRHSIARIQKLLEKNKPRGVRDLDAELARRKAKEKEKNV